LIHTGSIEVWVGMSTAHAGEMFGSAVSKSGAYCRNVAVVFRR
jgi:hypothetical protein